MRFRTIFPALCALLLAPSVASAKDCGCVPLALEESVERSDAVFLGTVESVRDSVVTLAAPPRGEARSRRLQAGFVRMQSIWKGVPSRKLTVFALPKGECKSWPGLAAGETYLVFANEDPAVGWRLDPCTGTAPHERSAESIKALGTPTVVQRLPALKNRPNN